MRSKRITETPPTYLLVFDRGDEVVQTLTAFSAGMPVAYFQAIGALERATLAYWNAETKKYDDIVVAEQVEVVSLIGDVTRDERGRTRVHAHASLGRADGSAVCGHLKSAVVRPTLELFLTVGEAEVRRRRDDETGLPLIDFGSE